LYEILSTIFLQTKIAQDSGKTMHVDVLYLTVVPVYADHFLRVDRVERTFSLSIKGRGMDASGFVFRRMAESWQKTPSFGYSPIVSVSAATETATIGDM
jgi:hypothetical protein